MAKKRTKKQKIKAMERRKEVPVAPSRPAVVVPPEKPKEDIIKEISFAGQDAKVIYRDLSKSLLVTLALVLLLFGFYIYLR